MPCLMMVLMDEPRWRRVWSTHPTSRVDNLSRSLRVASATPDLTIAPNRSTMSLWFCAFAPPVSNVPKSTRNPIPRILVCTENLNTGVVVMKSAQDDARTDDTGTLYRTRDRRILVQGSMSPDTVVVISARFHNPAEMCLAQNVT
jgi:hypothetical protein